MSLTTIGPRLDKVFANRRPSPSRKSRATESPTPAISKKLEPVTDNNDDNLKDNMTTTMTRSWLSNLA